MNKSVKKIGKYKERKFNKTIIFADIETIIIDDKHEVACAVMISENDCKSKKFNNLTSFMLYLIFNHPNSIVYFHNFGRFDSTFILNWIIKRDNSSNDIEVIERNNIIYEVSYKKFEISFRDSYLLINKPLKQIGETFCRVNKKLDFEYDDITEIFKSNPELVYKQCEVDCLVLREGFLNFRANIKKRFDIEICVFLTLPSLAFNLFKKNYYDPKKDPITKNPYETDEFIRRSYKGGVSEVFKPSLKKGYCYDANSLYPFCMSSNLFPVGKGKFIKGKDIVLNSFIGFIECRVSCDKELNFLTYKHPVRGLISPVGEWTDVYFYKEVQKAIELGYKITFIKGFKYEREAPIFKAYVKDLYNLRLTSESKAMKDIAKLLLNSLYGRFGMKPFVESTKFLKEDELEVYKKNYEIRNINYIGNNFYSISGIKRSLNEKDLYKNSIDTETAIQIASAITAYSRIFMYDFKNIKDNECYYTDTDSIFVKNKLNDKYIGNNLGNFKLEYEIEEAIFIAPKVYYVKKLNGEEKVVLKSLKKTEYNIQDIKKVFKNIINSKQTHFKTDRISIFKRNLLMLITYIEKSELKLTFSLVKRVKIFTNEVWTGTRAIRLKD